MPFRTDAARGSVVSETDPGEDDQRAPAPEPGGGAPPPDPYWSPVAPSMSPGPRFPAEPPGSRSEPDDVDVPDFLKGPSAPADDPTRLTNETRGVPPGPSFLVESAAGPGVAPRTPSEPALGPPSVPPAQSGQPPGPAFASLGPPPVPPAPYGQLPGPLFSRGEQPGQVPGPSPYLRESWWRRTVRRLRGRG
jgi:hypothetical protein